MLQRVYDHLVNRVLIRPNVDLVITKTKTAEQFMRGKGFKKAKTIPIGTDTRVFRKLDQLKARETLGIDHDNMLLYVKKNRLW